LFLIDVWFANEPFAVFPEREECQGGDLSLLADLTRRDRAALNWRKSNTFRAPYGNAKMIETVAMTSSQHVYEVRSRQIIAASDL
jgi:hypothetical protein